MKNARPRRQLLPCLFLGLLLMPAGLRAAITWNVTFNDVVNGTNVGFDDPTQGAIRQATFASVFSYLNTVLDESGSVDILVNNSQTDGAGSLAFAGPYFWTSPPGFSNGLLFDHATTGVDPWAGGPDATASFDFGFTWNSGLGAPSGGQFDLFSVALHEVTHSLGFLPRVTSSGTDSSGNDPGVYGMYASFLERGDGTPLFAAGGDFVGTPADLISNDVWFDGPQARAANGGDRVQVYAPGTWATGSSISHVQGLSSYVMQYAIAAGVERRTYTAPELGILGDIGWMLAVPEPSTFLLVLGGCLGLFSARRER